MKKNASLLLQVAIWASLWAILVFSGNDRLKPPAFLLIGTLSIISVAAFFNLTYYALMPIYFSKGQKKTFFVLSLLVFVVFLASEFFIVFLLIPLPPFRDTLPFKPRMGIFALIPHLFIGLIVFATAAMLRSFSAFEKKKQDEETANRRRMEAELALLKSQINPHFLLNTLNNLYGIALTEPEKTPEALLKLGSMVKYVLHECADPTVPLLRDLGFVKNYISLQQLRLPPNAQLKVEIPENIPDWPIEPMILIPFIENAFKHGLTTKTSCEIIISIKAEREWLAMRVENQVFPEKAAQYGNQSGIGIINTRQRLEHTYPGKHILKIAENKSRHRIELLVQLNPNPQSET